jgi:hypothetical protein
VAFDLGDQLVKQHRHDRARRAVRAHIKRHRHVRRIRRGRRLLTGGPAVMDELGLSRRVGSYRAAAPVSRQLSGRVAASRATCRCRRTPRCAR